MGFEALAGKSDTWGNRLYTKTQYAFQFTCEEYFRVNPRVYFWTFTFRVAQSDDEAMTAWHLFVGRILRHYPHVWGVRVTELHMFHGIHIHCFMNARIPIDHIRRIVRGSGNLVGRNYDLGFGRVGVVPCDKSEKSIYYLSNYLTKQYRSDNWFGKRRRWDTFGGFEGSRVRDIEYDSTAVRNRATIFGGARCSYVALMMTTHFSNLWGAVSEWPAEDLALVQSQPTAAGGCLVKQYGDKLVRLEYMKEV